MNLELLRNLLGVLNVAVFIRGENGAFRLAGPPPAWLASLWPTIAAEQVFVSATEFSPFLDNFLIDATAFWKSGSGRGPGSGTWIERDAQNQEIALEANALLLDGQVVLLVEDLGNRHRERVSALQLARETVLAHERLNLEIQKKEILAHCVIHDMAGQLSNLVTSLRLIEAENPTPKVRKLTGLATLAAQRQQDLINRVFETFMQEPDSLHGGGSPAGGGVDLAGFIRRTVDGCAAEAEKRGVKIVVEAAGVEGSAPGVIAEKVNLERLLRNLLQHALNHSPAGGTVRVSLTMEDDAALVEVEDECPDLPHDIQGAGFDAFARTSRTAIPDALALHFCRLAVENWGGQMGWSRREPAGNKFWFRLSRIQS